MDVLRPPIIIIQGRCYRKNPVAGSSNETDSMSTECHQPYVEQVDQVYCDEACDATDDIKKSDGVYRASMDIPSVFIKHIIGRKGETKKRIEAETQCQIIIPKFGQEGDIIIQGDNQSGVASAKTRIDLLVQASRMKQPFTHFLSIPINGSDIKRKFLELKDDILRECDGDRGIDASIFQNPDKLHLTIGVMTLLNEKEVNAASELLQRCQAELIQPIIQDEHIITHIKGLEYMNDEPGMVDVLYAKVESTDESNFLRILSEGLVDKFTTEGLMTREYGRVKLHITIMNSLMRKDPSGIAVLGRKPAPRTAPGNRESFDARKVLKLFGDHDFGQFTIGSLDLSQRHKVDKDGYYAAASRIWLS